MANGRFISYARVSTVSQGKSGLGLEAQRTAILAYLNGGNWKLLGEFVEVESGANDDRPELAKALAACRLHRATLLVAKTDRLSRDTHHLLGLEKAGYNYIAVDMPEAGDFERQIRQAVAQEERRMISDRTRTALAAAKARGVKLGGWRGGPFPDAALGGAARKQQADTFAREVVGPTLAGMRDAGSSLSAMALEMNRRAIPTAQDGKWTATAVRRVLARLD